MCVESSLGPPSGACKSARDDAAKPPPPEPCRARNRMTSAVGKGDRVRRRLLLAHGFGLSALITAVPRPVHARRLPTVGYLSLIPLSDPASPERQAFLDGLAGEGLAPGRGLEIVYASAEGNAEFLDDVARDLIARQPDVVVAAGPPALQALRRATRDMGSV